MPGEPENQFFLIRPALSTCGRAIRYPRLFHLATSLLWLLPISLLAADRFTTVDLGKALNTEHAKAFTETIGFDTWFAQPQVTLHGIPFMLTTGRADLVRLPPGGRVEMGLPVCQASVMHLLLTGGYLPTAGSVRVEVTYTNGFREEHTLDVNDGQPDPLPPAAGKRVPDRAPRME
jgi:hypothetical protein